MAVLQSGFRNLLHHSAIYDWLYHLIPLIDAINRSSSGKVKDIAEFPVQSESQSWSDASWWVSLTVCCSESLQMERGRKEERERESAHNSLLELQTSVPFQYKGNCHSSIWAKFQLVYYERLGGFERTTNFLKLNQRQVYKVFSFLEDTKWNEQTWLASRQSTTSLKLNLSKQ